EARFARDDLQRRFARKFFDCDGERTQQRQIGRADGEEDRDAERDAEQRQHRAELVLPPLLPRDVSKLGKHQLTSAFSALVLSSLTMLPSRIRRIRSQCLAASSLCVTSRMVVLNSRCRLSSRPRISS